MPHVHGASAAQSGFGAPLGLKCICIDIREAVTVLAGALVATESLHLWRGGMMRVTLSARWVTG